MTQKLLLAESLDLLRQCEIKEYDVDKAKERISGNSKFRNELPRLVQNYDAAYQQYVRGIEILNYVRHGALDDTNPRNAAYNKNLADFCAGKMNAYMDRCDNIVRKMDNILLPIDQIDQVTKEGYIPEETVYIQDGLNYPLTRKDKTLAKEFTLMDGTYILTVKNRDDYTLAAPDVAVLVTVVPQRGSGAEPIRASQSIHCLCGWRKVIGVVGAASLQIEVKSSGMRDSHVDVLIQKWRPIVDGAAVGPGPGGCPFDTDKLSTFSSDSGTSKPPSSRPPPPAGPPARGGGGGGAGGNNWVQQLPTLPDDELATLANYNVPHGQLPAVPQRPPGGDSADLWSSLETMNVPHVGQQGRQESGVRVPDPIEVNPAGMTCTDRMRKLRENINAWPAGGVMMANLPMDKQRIVQGIYALPLPRDLS